MHTNEQQSTSDFSALTTREWNRAVERHLQNLDAKVIAAIAQTVDEYILRVFVGARGTELTFIGDILLRYQAKLSKAGLSVNIR